MIEEARAKRDKCLKSWARLASWASAEARERSVGGALSRKGAPAVAPPGQQPWRAHFDAVWAGFLRGKTASRPRAEAAFAALTPDDQRGFAAAIGAVAAHIRGLKLSQPYDLARFIAERRFEAFSRSGEAASIMVKVHRDSRAGEAWERHLLATKGRGAPWSHGHWWFETAFPPLGGSKSGRRSDLSVCLEMMRGEDSSSTIERAYGDV